MALLGYVYAYLLGGVTFIPLMVVVFVLMQPKINRRGSKYDRPVAKESEFALADDESDSFSDKENDSDDDEEEELKAGEVEEHQASGLLAYKSGWITVTQEYVESPDDISSTTQSINETPDNKSAYSTLYKLVKNNSNNTNNSGTPEILENGDPANTSNSTSNGANNGDKVRSSVKKHRFYAVLKHGNLFLYKNQTLNDVKHVIVLSNQLVTIWPRNLIDGQLFTKYTAICLIKKNWTRSRRLSENFGSEKLTVNDILDPSNHLTPPKSSFFIHCDTNIDKEDWYFALIRSSKTDKSQMGSENNDLRHLDPHTYAKTLHFNTNDMIDLIQSLYSSEGNLQTKWFNALLGRIFLSLKDTDTLHDYFVDKIIKKLNKIKTPGFLEKFTLKSLNTGNSVPFFTFPNLKEINPNGTTVVTTYVHYHGSMSCNLATKVNLSLGGRFQKSLSQSVDVVLKVTLEKLEGPMVFKIKPPPSNRMWYCFEIEPIMNLKIEPIISARQFSYNILTNLIEKRFKDAIKDSLVAPHYDDIVFFNTSGELFRGGIWDKSVRSETKKNQDPNNTDSNSVSNSEMLHPVKSNTSSRQDLELESKSIKSFDTKSDITSVDSKVDDKLKLSSTLSDLSKKIKRAKSTHTVSVNGGNFLSDGSLMESDNGPTGSNSNRNATAGSGANNNAIGKTWKKIGDWYSNTNGNPNTPNPNVVSSPQQSYHKPEMISSRRRPRNSSNDIIPSSPGQGFHSFENDLNPGSPPSPVSRKGSNPIRKGSTSFSSPNINQTNTLPSENAFEMFVKPNDYPVSMHSRKNSRMSLSSAEADRWNDIEAKSELTFRDNESEFDNKSHDSKTDSNALDTQIHEELVRLEAEYNSGNENPERSSVGQMETQFNELKDPLADEPRDKFDQSRDPLANESGNQFNESGNQFNGSRDQLSTESRDHLANELRKSLELEKEAKDEEKPKLHRKSPPPL